MSGLLLAVSYVLFYGSFTIIWLDRDDFSALQKQGMRSKATYSSGIDGFELSSFGQKSCGLLHRGFIPMPRLF